MKKLISFILCIAMCISVLPMGIFAEGGDDSSLDSEKNLALTSKVTLEEITGAEKQPDGSYSVQASREYSMKLKFEETNELELDMEDYVWFKLPAGVLATDEDSAIEVEIIDEDGTRIISNPYSIKDEIFKVEWNKEDPSFEDLKRASGIVFTLSLKVSFDGTEDCVIFGTGHEFVINVDNTGSITVNKSISGLRSDVVLTDEDKAAMTFELRDENGDAVRSFTYADMENGENVSITFTKMTPGAYTVVETAHPDFENYTFNTDQSVTSDAGELGNGGVLVLDLANDYDYFTGNLELNKQIVCETWDNSDEIPESLKNSISFTITGPDNYTTTVAYKDFDADGKLLLSGLEIGEYTITESGHADGFDWILPENAETEAPTASAVVEHNSTASASFENKYKQQTADIIISKNAVGANVPGTAEFTVTFPDGTTTRTFTYSEMDNGTYTITNVPVGTYKLEEDHASADLPAYGLKVEGEGNFDVPAAGETTTAIITNTYSPFGSLKVEKTISGELTAEDLTEQQKADIIFEVYNDLDAKVATLSYGGIEAGNDTIAKLPVGTYTVKETAPQIDGYTMVAEQSEISVEVRVGETATASFKNEYTEKVYTLSVLKSFSENSQWKSIDALSDTIKDATVITVKQGSTVIRSCTLGAIDQLQNMVMPGPGPYTITETNGQQPGVLITTQVSSSGIAANGTSKSVTLEDGKPAAVEFINDYQFQGTIFVKKIVEGILEEDQDLVNDLIPRITYDLYSEDSAYYYPDNAITTTGGIGIIVPVGNYYIQESGFVGVPEYSGPDVSTKVIFRDRDDAVLTSAASRTKSFYVGLNETVEVEITNTYEKGGNGSGVKIIKFVKGLNQLPTSDEYKLDKDFADQYDLYNTAGALLYGDDNGIKFKIEQYNTTKAAWVSLGDLPIESFAEGVILKPGHYKLTELDANVTGHSLNVSYLIKAVGEGQQIETEHAIEFDIPDTTSMVEVEVHNNYTQLGNLTITKNVGGELKDVYGQYLSESASDVKFTVTGPYDFKDEFTFADIQQASDKNLGIKEYKDIPIGTYTIKEIAGTTTNYTLTSSSSIGADGTIDVPFNETASAVFTNNYTRKTGNLTIKKTLAGDYPENLSDAQKAAMTFEIKVTINGKTQKYTATYGAFENGSYTFSNIPIGTYTVTETIGTALTDSYNITISNNKKTTKVTWNKTATYEMTNTFERVGHLKLVKSFEGDMPTDAQKKNVAFRYWQIDDEGNMIGSAKTVSISAFTKSGNSYSKTIKNLKPGAYVIEELGDIDYFKRTTTVKVGGGASEESVSAAAVIEFGQTSTVSFNNNYEKVAALTVKKATEGVLSLNDDQKNAISFIVKDSDGNQIDTFSYADMENGARTISDLTPGAYTVTEIVTDPERQLFGDYKCETTSSFAGITAAGMLAELTLVHGANTLEFTNKYTKASPLSVSKKSSNDYKGLAEIDGIKYPVWQFTLTISNLTPETTDNGSTVITDVFDDNATHAAWFRQATASEVGSALGKTVLQPYSITSKVSGKAAPEAVLKADNSIEISGVTAETAAKCEFTYYLIVKDKDTLMEMNSPENNNSGVSYKFKNTVTYKPMPHKDEIKTAAAIYKYEFAAVGKEISNLNSKNVLVDSNGSRVNYALYEVTLNEKGISLGDGATIEATDTYSTNQSIVASSITASINSGFSYKLDAENHKITFTIPNGTPVKVSYKVNIANTGSEQVRLQNEIDLKGFSTGIDENVTRTLQSIGSTSIYSVNVLKQDAENPAIVLEGVKFALCDGYDGTLLAEGVTSEQGQLKFKYWGEDSFKVNYEYKLIEESTVTGYALRQDPIRFKITTADALSIVDDVYNLPGGSFLGLELVVTNAPITATLKVTKEFNDWSKAPGGFRFKLEALDGAPMPEAGYEYVTVNKNSTEGAFGIIRLPISDESFAEGDVVTYNYTIQEVVENKIPGVRYDETKYPAVITVTSEAGIKTVAVSYNGSDNLVIENVYEDGSLTVKKNLAGNDVEADRQFEFTITLGEPLTETFSDVAFTNGVARIYLKGGESKSISGIPNGVSYSVSETSYAADGYETTSTSASGVIIKTEAAKAVFTNTRNSYGSLKVSKVLAGNAADAGKAFSFKVELSDKSLNGTYGNMSFTNGVAEFTLKGGESKTASGLPNGAAYTVTEADYSEIGYVTTSTGAVGTIVKNTTQEAKITNTRNANGALSVAKALAGNDTDSNKEFTFTITLAGIQNTSFSGVEFDTNGAATITLKGGQSKLIEGIPNGTGYEVSEADYSADGYTAESSGVTGSISESVIASAIFTNTRNTYGDLTVTKATAGNAPDTSKAFSFKVTLGTALSGTFGDMTFADGVAEFTLKNGESKTAKNLPNGVHYTVTEDDYSAAGYVTTKQNDNSVIIGGSATTAAFTNTRNADGSLTVSKKLAGNDTDSNKEFTFTITLGSNINKTLSGVEFTNGVATITLKGNEFKTIEGIPNGTAYTVEEADYTADGYTPDKNNVTGTISENAPALVEITNTRNTYGTLTVKKTLSGNAAEAAREFRFTITLSDNTVSGVHGDMTFTDGVAEFTLKGGESKTASGLPNGAEYEVTEEDLSSESYSVTKTGETGVIAGNVDAEAEFDNYRNFNDDTYEPKPINPPKDPEEDPKKDPEDPTDIPDPEVPLSGGDSEDPEELEDLEDPEIPLADVPYTGDSTALYILILCAAFVSLAALKRRKDEE